MAAKIRKGDLVQVISGPGSGQDGQPAKRGRVLEVFPDSGKVLVEGVNVVTKNRREARNKAGQVTGGRTTQEAAIPASRVALVDPATDKPTRVGFNTNEKGEKVRVARTKGTGTVLDN
ncbi:MAG: 50S ribosomal protein L24 [Candidatus Sumerlaeia bacterium]|nr:50S ribosomal protein L24 [Candidatus Sumerlaeia bacterium]